MHPARRQVWFLMRKRRAELVMARIELVWGDVELAAQHRKEAALLLAAAREWQRLARRQASLFAAMLAALALLCVVASNPLG